MGKLTKAQRALLLDLSDAVQPNIYCDAGYKPAIALVNMGLAEWERTERLRITPAGRLSLSQHGGG